MDEYQVIADHDEIRRGLRIMAGRNEVLEIRALGAERQGTISGYYDLSHREEAVAACAEWSGRAEGVYLTPNPVNPDLLARSANRWKAWARHTTSDSDILRRRWLLLDFDAVRPAGISSTEDEHDAAIARAGECAGWLCSFGLRPASIVFADSGNGAHLNLRVDLPSDATSQALVKRVIEAADLRFSDDVVKVDLTTYNAARIWKVYGTMAAKGDSIPGRPHRLAKILAAPDRLRLASPEALARIASTLPAQPAPSKAPIPTTRTGVGFDVAAWIERHNISVAQEKPWEGGKIWVLDGCPWNRAHTNGSAYIILHRSGAVSAGCHHDGCRGKDWHSLRDLVEPGWRSQRSTTARDGRVPSKVFEKVRRLLSNGTASVKDGLA